MNAKLTGVNADDAHFTGADLAGADLSNSHLVDADLNGANLGAATLFHADLTGATVVGTMWVGARRAPTGTSSDADGGACTGHL